jgi:hypothetical protein
MYITDTLRRAGLNAEVIINTVQDCQTHIEGTHLVQ